MVVFIIILALGTFLFFPRLAKALVGLALLGVLAGAIYIATCIYHEEFVARPARESASLGRHTTPPSWEASKAQAEADYALLTQRHAAGLDRDNLAAQSCVLNGTRLMFVEIREVCRQAVLALPAASTSR